MTPDERDQLVAAVKALPSVSVRGQRYVSADGLAALLAPARPADPSAAKREAIAPALETKDAAQVERKAGRPTR